MRDQVPGYSFTSEKSDAGLRLDIYLVKHLPGSRSRAFVQRLIHRDSVLVNGTPRKSHYKVRPGDFIEVDISKPEKIEIKPENIPLDIIYEDERLLVVDKPAGMVVHPAPGNYSGTLVNALLYHIGRLSASSEGRPGIVHRLDKDTSGLLIVAKDEAAHSFISRQFTKGAIDKRYIAVVEGIVQLDNGVISYPIGRHARDRKRMSVRFQKSKNAVTHYRVLERYRDKTLLEARPLTGRTHQIRVHLNYIGHPILGDKTYGRKRNSPIARHALHASEISFFHPETKERVSFRSPLAADIKRLIDKIKNKKQ